MSALAYLCTAKFVYSENIFFLSHYGLKNFLGGDTGNCPSLLLVTTLPKKSYTIVSESIVDFFLYSRHKEIKDYIEKIPHTGDKESLDRCG